MPAHFTATSSHPQPASRRAPAVHLLKPLLTLLLAFLFLTAPTAQTARAEARHETGTEAAPLATIAAASAENAAKAACLLYDSEGDRDGAIMETCALETLHTSVENGIVTMELYALHATFAAAPDGSPNTPSSPVKLGSGVCFVKLRLQQVSEREYALLEYVTPARRRRPVQSGRANLHERNGGYPAIEAG